MKKINTTQDIKPNSILRVYKKGYGYSKIKVIDVNDFFIAALTDNNFIRHVKNGEQLLAYLWIDNIASYEFKVKLIGTISIEHKILFFNHTDEFKISRKRKCLSAEVEIPFKFFTLDVENVDKKFSTRGIEFLKGTLIKLSDREAVLQSPKNLEKGTFFKGHLLLNKYMIDVVGKVIQKKVSQKKNLYQLDFTGTHDDERNKILDYIFSVYRE